MPVLLFLMSVLSQAVFAGTIPLAKYGCSIDIPDTGWMMMKPDALDSSGKHLILLRAIRQSPPVALVVMIQAPDELDSTFSPSSIERLRARAREADETVTDCAVTMLGTRRALRFVGSYASGGRERRSVYALFLPANGTEYCVATEMDGNQPPERDSALIRTLNSFRVTGAPTVELQPSLREQQRSQPTETESTMNRVVPIGLVIVVIVVSLGMYTRRQREKEARPGRNGADRVPGNAGEEEGADDRADRHAGDA